ncbi:nSTAND1 domain-containing NTPase [Kibdelosporangium aridum]|uniref:nSTAND1 domain-containing NTPase n=1 Tax=Kibdelosporangium aridum TaxID=2030 RepID=UPI000A4E2C12
MARAARGGQPDPWAAADQAEFRQGLRDLIRWAGYGSLQQLEVGAASRGTSMPVSTANRALNNDRLPTAEFVERIAQACGVPAQPWLSARDALADRPYLRDVQPPESVHDSVCPYPGLAAFTSDQAQWFFGREETTADLLDQLAAANGPLLVSGPSGTGKSSLLHAGLLPALRAGRLPGSAQWSCVAFTPTGKLPATLAECDLVVVDQFEEVFTLCTDEAQRRQFIETLCVHPRVVLGMRADFLGHCAAYPGLVKALKHGQVLLGPMTDEQLRAAMEKPAAAAGLDLQPGLVEVVLGDLGGGALPLLAHTLMATWRHRCGRMLTIEGYRLTGGVAGAVAKTAERAYQRLSAEQQERTRPLMSRMIQFGDGNADTRRQLDRARLTDEDQEVLDALVDARLVTAHESTVVLAHEAILQAWPRLRDWIQADRARLLVEQRLLEAAEAWERDGRHDSDLYRGHRLAAVLELPNPAAKEFVRASVERERAEQRAAARRTRRLRQMVAVLSCLVLIAAAMTVITVVSRQDIAAQRDIGVSRQVASTAIALRSADLWLAGQLAVAAYKLFPTAEARGAVMTTLANLDPVDHIDVSSGDVVQTVAFSHDKKYLVSASRDGYVRVWPLGDPPSLAVTPFQLAKQPDQVRAAVFDPTGRYLATSGRDGVVRLWSMKDLGPAAVPALEVTGSTGERGPLAFSGDGTLLVTGAQHGGNVTLWDLAQANDSIATFGAHRGEVLAVAFSKAGRLVATGASDGTVKVWNLADSRNPVLVWQDNRNAGPIHAVAFGNSDRLLVTANDDATATIWDVGEAAELATLSGHLGVVYGVAFDPSGRLLATATIDTAARIWDVSDPRNPTSWAVPLAADSDNAYWVAFHPDGRTLASASFGNAVRLWDMDIDRAVARICAITPTISPEQWAEHLADYTYRPPCPNGYVPVPASAEARSSKLIALHSGKCLASRAAVNSSATPVYQFRCGELHTGLWTFGKTGTDYRIRNTTTNMCLDSRPDESRNGDAYLVVQRQCSDAVSQLWTLQVIGETENEVEAQLKQRTSRECLDVNHSNSLDGALAIRWQCAEAANQVFRVSRAALN